MTTEPCEICENTGHLDCEICHGKGRTGGVFGRFMNTCEVCDGTGKEPCFRCEGSGLVLPTLPGGQPGRRPAPRV